VPIIIHPRPQARSFSSCPSHENSAQAEPSRAVAELFKDHAGQGCFEYSFPCQPLVNYQINRQFSEWILPPQVIRAFGGALPTADIGLLIWPPENRGYSGTAVSKLIIIVFCSTS
jgi:hypothetical protein